MDQALERRKSQDADIVLGALELWIGIGRNQSWPWLDVAVRIGKGWGAFLDLNGPMVQRPGFVAFVAALRDFVEGRRNDAILASIGGSMRIFLRRSEHGSLHGEAWFNHGTSSQTVHFGVWQASLIDALEPAEAALERVLAAPHLGWVPYGDALDYLPHASEIEPLPEARPFDDWESETVPDGEVRFDYLIDGYGWYGVTVFVGDRRGEFGGGYLTDPMGDLLRAALMLLADAPRASLECNSEPGMTQVEFVPECLRLRVDDQGLPIEREEGVRIRILSTNPPNGELELEFEALAPSRRAVAEAIYAMALAHFKGGAGPWSAPFAALEGALKSVPRAG